MDGKGGVRACAGARTSLRSLFFALLLLGLVGVVSWVGVEITVYFFQQAGYVNTVCERPRANVVALADLALQVDSILARCEITYFLDMGGLLGAFRHGNVLEHDKDVDFALLPERASVGAFNSVPEVEKLREKVLNCVRPLVTLASLFKLSSCLTAFCESVLHPVCRNDLTE